MKIPQALKIAGRDYKIFYPYTFKDNLRPLYGLHDSATQTIRITDRDENNCIRNRQAITHTFLHEVLHAIDNCYFAGHLSTWDQGENAIDQLAEGLLQVIRDNNLDFRK